MGALPQAKLAVLRTLVEQAPDRVVGELRGALADTGADSALVDVRLLVEREARDRQVRNAALAPIAPLCVGDGRTEHLSFPARALALVWRGLREQAVHEIGRAEALYEEFKAEESSPEPFDALARRAARGVRERNHPKFAAAADLAEAARPDGARLLAECLQMTPILRSAVARLPDWMQRMSGEDVAVARIAYRDVAAISDDSGPRFFDMLSAHLPQPWMVLRLISAIMDRPPEAYVAGSELAPFGLRILEAIDADLARLEAFDPAEGPAAVRAAARAVEAVTAQAAELENDLDLSRRGAWGQRLARQKALLARAVERRLDEAERAVKAVLPTTVGRIGRIVTETARLSEPPAAEAVQRAKGLIAFVLETRCSADRGGFAAAHAAALTALRAHLDSFVDDALDRLKAGEAEDPAAGRALVHAAAGLIALAEDRQAAETVRRRLAAA